MSPAPTAPPPTRYSTETTGPKTPHELQSIAYPGGTHDYFAYDDQGPA